MDYRALRAQTFEVLTGGDLTADEAEGYDDHKKAEGEEAGLRFVALPDSMVDAMRVNLHVWADDTDRNDSEQTQGLQR